MPSCRAFGPLNPGPWDTKSRCVYGATLSNLAVFFVAFIGSTPLDFYGKVVMDFIAVVLLIRFALRLKRLQLLRLPLASLTAVIASCTSRDHDKDGR